MKQKLHNSQSSRCPRTAARARVRLLVLRRLSLYMFVIAALATLSLSDSAVAQGPSTLEEAASEIRASHKGARILKAEPKTRSDGSKVFRFRLLTRDGVVKTIRLSPDADADTAAKSAGDEQRRKRKKRRE